MIASLRRALDLAYAGLTRAARKRWEENFSRRHEASDHIVSVRITKSKTQRGSAFLQPRAQAQGAPSRHLIARSLPTNQ